MALARAGTDAEGMRAFCPTWTDAELQLRAEWLHTCDERAVRASYEGFHTDDFHADAAQLAVPSLLITAERGDVVRDDDVAELQRATPSMRHVRVPDAGHMIPWDNAAGFTRRSATSRRAARGLTPTSLPHAFTGADDASQRFPTDRRVEAGAHAVAPRTGPDRHDPDERGHPPADAVVRADRAANDGRDRQPLDLPPVNGDKAFSRDPLAYLGTTPLTGNRAAIAALRESDLVLDLMTLLFSPEQHEILKSGTKILLAVEPPEVLVRLVPTLADRTRVLAAAKQIAAAREMRVTSAAGTALVCPLGEFPPTAEYGFVDAPGRWDHWPSGFALTYPNDRTRAARS